MKASTSSVFRLLFLILTLTALMPSRAFSDPGPRSREAADFLFAEGEQEAHQEKLEPARRHLKKFVELYPSDARVARVTELLLTLAMKQKDYDDAITQAQAYLHLDSQSETAQRVRSQLVQVYAAQNKPLLARATAKELLKKAKNADTQAETLFTLARIDLLDRKLGQKRYRQARAKLDALPAAIAPERLDSLKLEIGIEECRDIAKPSKKTKGDDPWIEYFEKQNYCFKALAATHSQTASASQHPHWCNHFQSVLQELYPSRINPYQLKRLLQLFDQTLELARGFSCPSGDIK